MTAEAVSARLRELSRLVEARGFVNKGVDMSAPAVTRRIEVLASLSDMCWRLAIVGQGLRPGSSAGTLGRVPAKAE